MITSNFDILDCSTQRNLSKDGELQALKIGDFFKNNDIKYHYCEMNNDLKLFHKYDFHPNKLGYKNLKACVLNVLNSNF